MAVERAMSGYSVEQGLACCEAGGRMESQGTKGEEMRYVVTDNVMLLMQKYCKVVRKVR